MHKMFMRAMRPHAIYAGRYLSEKVKQIDSWHLRILFIYLYVNKTQWIKN